MRISKFVVIGTFLLAGLSSGVYASNDTGTRAMGLGQSYTALARGSEAPFWNPANLALGGGVKFSWDALALAAVFGCLPVHSEAVPRGTPRTGFALATQVTIS